MYIAKVEYTNNDENITQSYLISDINNTDVDSLPDDGSLSIIGYDVPIVDAIFCAAAKDIIPCPFVFNNYNFTLTKYIKNSEERKFNKYRKNYVVSQDRINHSHELFIYSQRCRCTWCYSEWRFDHIISVCGLIGLYDDPKKTVPVDMHKCKNCGRYFIDKISFERYQNKYGKLYVKTKMITGNEIERDVTSFLYDPDTILSRNGYSTKLPYKERKQILINMMEHGINKAEIIDIFCYFINTRRRCVNAVEIWKNDLKFVRDYVIGTLPIVYFG